MPKEEQPYEGRIGLYRMRAQGNGAKQKPSVPLLQLGATQFKRIVDGELGPVLLSASSLIDSRKRFPRSDSRCRIAGSKFPESNPRESVPVRVSLRGYSSESIPERQHLGRERRRGAGGPAPSTI